jgi:hypothetical protein
MSGPHLGSARWRALCALTLERVCQVSDATPPRRSSTSTGEAHPARIYEQLLAADWILTTDEVVDVQTWRPAYRAERQVPFTPFPTRQFLRGRPMFETRVRGALDRCHGVSRRSGSVSGLIRSEEDSCRRRHKWR